MTSKSQDPAEDTAEPPHPHLDLPDKTAIAARALHRAGYRQHIRLDADMRSVLATLSDTGDGWEIPHPHEVEELIGQVEMLAETLEDIHALAHHENE
jgi:hypothetical protein